MSIKNQPINLSPLIIGVMNWGIWGKNMTAQEMSDFIMACCDEGLSSFDHAAIYGGYSTETAFGEAFGKTGLNRRAVQFISKCGIQYPSTHSPYKIKHYDYSAKEIIRSAEQSLSNLKTDFLDVLLFHRPSPVMALDEILEALNHLFSSGKVLSFGVSNFESSKIDLIKSVVPVAYNQIEFSLTHHTPLTDGQLDYMQLHHIQPMAWKPLGNVFSAAFNQVNLMAILTKFSKKYNCSVDVLLLAWLLKHPTKVIPVIGTTSIARVINQKTSKDINLSLEDWFEMYEGSMERKVP
jgi:predicted oxidoreductase